MASEPSPKTIKRVVEYLESIELGVYGPCVDLDTGTYYGANMDLGPDEVLKYRKLYRGGKIHDEPKP